MRAALTLAGILTGGLLAVLPLVGVGSWPLMLAGAVLCLGSFWAADRG